MGKSREGRNKGDVKEKNAGGRESQTDKLKKVNVTRKGEVENDGHRSVSEEEREGGSSVHAPLPLQRGLLPGGAQDFKPLS